MNNNAQHCSFVLLAEFDIDRGAQLTYQFPQPLGTDEGLLANLMLPDGAEKQLEDWTVFFLNQTSFNTIEPVLPLETSETSNDQNESKELLHVMNLVRTKHDKTVRRGAVVKAMAICTRHPFIQIFKPVLLMALDDYYNDPSQDCLARLFDAVNSMDISSAPTLTRAEKIVMRYSDHKAIFAEKFIPPKPTLSEGESGDSPPETHVVPKARGYHRPTGSQGSITSFGDGSAIRSATANIARERERADSVAGTNVPQPRQAHSSDPPGTPSEASFSLGGSAVWVGDESVLDGTVVGTSSVVGSLPSTAGSSTYASHSIRGRKTSTDAMSVSSHSGPTRAQSRAAGAHPSTVSAEAHFRATVKDTRFFQTSIAYKGHRLPIKLPLSTFPEEVGDYSLIQLIQTLSQPAVVISGPLHPHLHSNGSLTHPVILLFNALITGKRIIFLGHNRPAVTVSTFVLSACALGSGCGAVLRGFIERAFPYANLTNRDEWETVPGYIAGVTNPIFEASGSWDLLIDVSGGRVVVSKDIHSSCPPTPLPSLLGIPLARTTTNKGEGIAGGGEDDSGRLAATAKADFKEKADSPDNLFMEDITSAITYHFPEGLIRNRFSEFVGRFIRLATRYEEETIGSAKTGWPTANFVGGPNGHLGSGLMFPDDNVGMKELHANAPRIEGWRRTEIHRYLEEDSVKAKDAQAIKNIDIPHQLYRLRNVKNMGDGEVQAIMHTISSNLYTYDQVVELLSHVTANGGSLHPITFGLFHQQELIRDLTVDILEKLRTYPVGVLYLQTLNHFHRYAYVRQAHVRETHNSQLSTARENPSIQPNNQLYPQAPSFYPRAPSIRSDSSLGVI